MSASSTKQSQKSLKGGNLYPKMKQKEGLSYSLIRNSISNSNISKKLSPKILDSQIKTNFYDSSIYKSQIEKTTQPDMPKRKSSKNITSTSFYSMIILILYFN
jgi:hypothetical protein